MNGKIESLRFKNGVNRIRFTCLVLYLLFNSVLLFVLGGCSTKTKIVPPGGTADPKVVSESPSNASTEVPINANVTAIFNGAMDPATISTAAFILTDDTMNIDGQVTYDDLSKSARFDPDSDLDILTLYTVKLTTGVKDKAGNPLDADYGWTFTTGTLFDSVHPTVVSTYPPDAESGVYIISNIAATFSESMDPSTINTSTFILSDGTSNIEGQLTYDDSSRTAFFNPDSDMALSTLYTVTITTGMKDVAGYSLETENIFSFETSSVEPPSADFSADAPSGYARHTVKFTDKSSGSIDTRAWDFDNDGFVDSTVQDPTHVYYHAGMYEVKLTVAGQGGPDEIVKSDYIFVDIGSPEEHTVEDDFFGAHSVFTSDIDGDGDIDVVGAAYNADTITWWENTSGDGSLWTGYIIDYTFDGSCFVRTADVDGDGDIDVIGAAFADDTICWWENDSGDGSSWTEHIVDSSFLGARSVQPADVDGDGDIDMIGSAYDADTITWWENSLGDGSLWTKHIVDSSFDGARSVQPADIDGDGDVDVVGAAYDADTVTWWENSSGDGSTWTGHTVDSGFDGAISVYTSDVDGDGDEDVIGTAYEADSITWWENSPGDGSSWTEHTVDSSFDGAISVHASDVDGDGDIDIVGAAYEEDSVTWWENSLGDGNSWIEHTVDSSFDGAISVHTSDVDGDGDTDILGAASAEDNITWWFIIQNNGNQSDHSIPIEYPVESSFDAACSVYPADIDGDGDIDVLGAAFNANTITWWENASGDGSSWVGHTITSTFRGAISVHASDVDGDGDIDVLGAASNDGDITWWENTSGDGSSWTGHPIDEDFIGAYSVHVDDIDGDGDIDVLGASYSTDTIAWWENTNGDGSSWTEYPVDEDFVGAHSVHAADVDGDGDIDVLGAAITADDIAWWENTTGDGSVWDKNIVYTLFNGAQSVYAADVDGDGDIDVLGAASVDNDIAWWENTAGDGSTWTGRDVDTNFNGAQSVHAADIDGDGDIDVLGAASVGNDITWWENTSGDGITWTGRVVDASFNGARSVHAADIDSDGDMDVLAAASSADAITWWEIIR